MSLYVRTLPLHAFTPEDVFVIHCSPQAFLNSDPPQGARQRSTVRIPIFYTLRRLTHCPNAQDTESARNRFRGLQRAIAGSLHRDFGYSLRPQRMGAVCRLGSDGK